MKKFIITLTLFLATPFSAFATSGACSGHGGVSCSAGQDSDGSVICVDGWRNSSVSYSSMAKCAGYSIPEDKVEPAVPAPQVEPIVKPTIKEAVSVPKPANVIKPLPAKKVEPKVKIETVEPEVQKVDQPVVRVVPENVPTQPVPGPEKKVSFWTRIFGSLFK